MSREPGSPLRRRVLMAIMAVTVVGVLLFALPLALAVQRLYRGEAVTVMERDATRAATVIPDSFTGSPVSVPPAESANATVGVYDLLGRRIAGTGPGRSALAASGRGGRARDAIEGTQLAVIVPIPSDQTVAGTVRVATPYDHVTDRVQETWAAMAMLGLLAVGLAAILARSQAIRLAAPLERLRHLTRALGDGDFTIRPERSGVREADSAGQALEATAARLGQLLERERAFGSDVSHQLRTPLTALTIGLESALERPDADLRAAVRAAIGRSEHLRSTIEDLLTLVRRPDRQPPPLDLDSLTRGIRDRWGATFAARGRSLDTASDHDLPACSASAAAVRQILDVLIDNALSHGHGTVSVAVRDTGMSVAIEVSDEGPGLAGDGAPFAPAPGRPDGHGRGLPLARSLALAAGGRLVLRRSGPCPVFSLLLPADGDGPGYQPTAPGSHR